MMEGFPIPQCLGAFKVTIKKPPETKKIINPKSITIVYK